MACATVTRLTLLVAQCRLFGRFDAVLDIRARFGFGDLVRARVGADDARETLRQRRRGLAVAATGVPRQLAIGRLPARASRKVAADRSALLRDRLQRGTRSGL
jgi:hypothetical protein